MAQLQLAGHPAKVCWVALTAFGSALCPAGWGAAELAMAQPPPPHCLASSAQPVCTQFLQQHCSAAIRLPSCIPSLAAQVMHHPDLGHGGILLAPQWQAQFVANLRAMLAARR